MSTWKLGSVCVCVSGVEGVFFCQQGVCEQTEISLLRLRLSRSDLSALTQRSGKKNAQQICLPDRNLISEHTALQSDVSKS